MKKTNPKEYFGARRYLNTNLNTDIFNLMKDIIDYEKQSQRPIIIYNNGDKRWCFFGKNIEYYFESHKEARKFGNKLNISNHIIVERKS